MAKCRICGCKFDIDDARMEYEMEFEDISYDDEYDGRVCADCAICDTESNINLGKAIMMMNGDEDYDDDFVQQWL